MADAKISELTSAGTLTGAEVFPLVQSAATKKAALSALKAAGSDLQTMTDDIKFLTSKAVADAAALVTLTDASTIAVDFAAGINFVVTLGGNRTLGAPSNAKPGTTGTILVKQDGTGSRTLAYNAAWVPFGSTPSLTTTASAVDLISWVVETSGKVRFTLTKGGAA